MNNISVIENIIEVKGFINPFQPNYHAHKLCAGLPLSEVVDAYIAKIAADKDTPAHIQRRMLKYCNVFVNNISVPREDWPLFTVHAGDDVFCNIIPHGGGGGRKNPLATVLTIAVMAGTFVASGGISSLVTGAALASGVPTSTAMFMAGAGAKILGGLAAAAVTTVGMLAINAICPVKAVDTNVDSKSGTAYSISSGRNQFKHWQSVPVVLGRHKTAPVFAVQPYTATENRENKQKWFAVYAWSYASNGWVSDLKIGDTLVSSLSYGTVYPVSRILSPGQRLYNFNDLRTEIDVGAELKQNQILTRTAPYAGKLEIDIYFPGLYRVTSSGGMDWADVWLRAEYRKTGTAGEWISFTGTTDIDAATVVLGIRRAYPQADLYYVGLDQRDYSIAIGTEKNIDSSYIRLYRITIKEYGILYTADMRPPVVAGFSLSARTFFTGDNWKLEVSTSAGTLATADLRVVGQASKVLNYTFSTPWITEDVYDVRVTRLTSDSDKPNELINQSFWRVLRGISRNAPIKFNYPLYVTELRVNANEELNGAVDTLTGVFENYIPDWNGSNWNTVRPTSNPASIIRYILTGDPNERRVDANMIDNDSLVAFHQHCARNSFTYNKVVESAQDIMDLLSEVAAAGRGFVVQPYGKYAVVYDDVKDAPRQHFTPANSWGFSSTRRFSELPHAFRVSFFDEANDYTTQEEIVYAPGYNVNNASLYENIEIPGVTNRSQIYRMTYEYIKAARLRPETHTLNVDMEYLISQRRDLVRVSHDVLMIGLAYGRLKSALIDNGRIVGVEIESTSPMETGKIYGITIRSPGAGGKPVIIERQVVTEPGEQYSLMFTAPIPADSSAMKAGDLYSFGEFGNNTQDYIISHIEPTEGLNAKITLINYAPEIYNNDVYIPPYKPNISQGANPSIVTPAAPTNISHTERIELRGNEAVNIAAITWLPPVSTPVPVDNYQFAYRISGSDDWDGMIYYSTRLAELNLAEGFYDFRIRSVSAYGQASAWEYAYNIYIYGDTMSLPDVAGLVTYFSDGRMMLKWDAVNDIRPATYEVRLGPSWLEGQVIQAFESLTCPLLIDGTYWVKARTRSGVYSVNPAWVTVTGVAGLRKNVIATWEESPDWAGAKENFYMGAIAGAIRLDGADAYGVYTIPENRSISLSAPAEATISVDYTARAYKASDIYTIPDMYAVNDIYEAIDGGWSVNIEIRTMNDNDQWGDWERLNVGNYIGKVFDFRLRADLTDDEIYLIVYNFSYSVDVPDRRETRTNQPITSAGFTWTFTPPFNNPPGNPQAIVGTIVEQADDDRTKKVSVDKNVTPGQALIYITNESGQRVSGMANLYAQGY